MTCEAQRQRLPSDLKIVLALKVYPGFSKETPNLQIFLGKTAKVLRAWISDGGINISVPSTFLETCRVFPRLPKQTTSKITAQPTRPCPPQQSRHCWCVIVLFPETSSKISWSLSELQAQFPFYRSWHKSIKLCAIKPSTLAFWDKTASHFPLCYVQRRDYRSLPWMGVPLLAAS